MRVETLPQAVVVHAMDGRTRLRIADRRENVFFFASVAKALSAVAGVRTVEVKPLTGSILIFHDAPLSRIGEAAERGKLFSLVIEPAPSRALHTPAATISPRMAAAAGLGLIALWQAHKEKFFPSALSLVLYAANLAGFLSQEDASGAQE
jgi:hypothetical protein